LKGLRAGTRASLGLFREAVDCWLSHNAPRLGAALAYYTLFSLAPLLVVAVAVAALVFSRDVALGHIVGQLRDLVGDAGAQTVAQMIESSRKAGRGALATVASLLTLFLGATGAFLELKGALNIIWGVEEGSRPFSLMSLLRARLASFAMVLAVGFLLLVSLVVSAVIAAANGVLSGLDLGPASLLQGLNVALSLVAFTILFAFIFKFVPDTRIAWGDVWVGAAITSVLFTAGKHVIGLYLGRSSFSSAYGAAGSLVVLIGWVYYAAQIFFFGAELTQAYSRRHGSRAPALRSLFQPPDQPGLLAPTPGSNTLRGVSFALLRESDR
jgi:membrane protein